MYTLDRKGGAFHTVAKHGVKRDESPSAETLPTRKHASEKPQSLEILGQYYRTDSVTNVTPQILSKLDKKLHNKEHHPLNLIHQRIKNHFYTSYQNRLGNPQFTMFDNLKPVVTVHQNFDSLLVPEGLHTRPHTAFLTFTGHVLSMREGNGPLPPVFVCPRGGLSENIFSDFVIFIIYRRE